jgi:putative intracellular protease/amidase
VKDPDLKYSVILYGRTLETITTMGGLYLTPEVLIDTIYPGPDDIIVIPGADIWLEPAQVPVIAKVNELLDDGAVVAAICGATMGLANAGLLDNRPHTSNDLMALKMFCPNYEGESVYINDPAVTDRNLITASGFAPVEIAYHIFRRLGVMNPETLEAWYGLFTTRKPEYFSALIASLSHAPGSIAH